MKLKIIVGLILLMSIFVGCEEEIDFGLYTDYIDDTSLNDINDTSLNDINDTSFTECWGIYWNWEDKNKTNCRCSKKHYNISSCDEFTQLRYCLNDWEGWLKNDYFREQIYPYLNYDCETGELLEVKEECSGYTKVKNIEKTKEEGK